MITTEAPGIEEQYVSACHSSNLRDHRTDSGRKGAIDVIMAAAMSPSRLGAALLRLHSEWDGCEKPRKWTPALIAELTDKLAGPKVSPADRGVAGVKAMAQAHQSYVHEMGILFGKLKTMPSVRSQIVLELQAWGIEDAQTIGPAILLHWLDSVCHPCGGLKFTLIPNSPALSKNRCKACGGVGTSRVPYGEVGKKMENYLDDCTHRARQQIGKRLRAMTNRV